MSWQVFDKLYLRYDEWFDTFPGREIFELELECLKNSLKDVPKPWLEVGIGTGRFAKALGVDFGVDPSIEMLKVALKRNLKVTKATAEHLPFDKRSFGGVIMVVTLCFLDNSLVFSDVICFYYKNIKCAVKLVLEILRKSCYNVSQVTWLYRMGAN